MNEKYKRSKRNRMEIATKSLAVDRKSVACDTKTKRTLQKIDKESRGNRFEIKAFARQSSTLNARLNGTYRKL